MKKQRKHYAPEEKLAIPRRHLLEKEPISKLCETSGCSPRSSTASPSEQMHGHNRDSRSKVVSSIFGVPATTRMARSAGSFLLV